MIRFISVQPHEMFIGSTLDADVARVQASYTY